MSSKPTIFIIFYSIYGHVYTLAKEIQSGLESKGVNVKLYQIPETLSEEILQKIHAPPRRDIPDITVDELEKADGIIWGLPTRFGLADSSTKAFFDSTGGLWASGALAGKPTSVFFSTAGQHGGQESTVFNTITYFAHHGMIYVPLGFANPHMFDNSEVVGSSAWGAGTVAHGDGSRQVSDKEKAIAKTQAENFANFVLTMQKGKNLLQQQQQQQEEKINNNNNSTTTTAPVTPSKTPTKQEKEDKHKGVSKCFCM
ncbi:flavoprotein-like protein [Halteromyces radiatus]|uniref:flavoprotein-like protein n=1 Tax=Halteromyces radiatus TaxID=101107 RepID=UPI00221F1E77|nr:flavoprotein-like protein [Halteromyces radiatus]KAI8093589.1 flavoprotein-like protein [Halteromyces radiatus]